LEQERGRRGRKRKMSGGAGKEELGRERARSVWPEGGVGWGKWEERREWAEGDDSGRFEKGNERI